MPRSRIVKRDRNGKPALGKGRGGSFEAIEHDDHHRDLAAIASTACTAWSDEPPVVATSSTIATVEPGSSGPSTSLPVPWPLASLRTRKPRRWPRPAPDGQGQSRADDRVGTQRQSADCVDLAIFR